MNFKSFYGKKKTLKENTTNLLKSLNEINIQLDLVKINKLDIFNSAQGLYDNMKEVIIESCRLIHERKEKNSHDMLSRIIEHVNNCCLSYDISLNRIAEDFDMTASNLSKLFKDNHRIIDFH